MGYMKSITLCLPLFLIDKTLYLNVISYVTLLPASLFLVIVTFSCRECFSYDIFSHNYTYLTIMTISHNVTLFLILTYISQLSFLLFCTSRYKSIASSNSDRQIYLPEYEVL